MSALFRVNCGVGHHACQVVILNYASRLFDSLSLSAFRGGLRLLVMYEELMVLYWWGHFHN